MLIVKVSEEKNIDAALKIYKKKVQKVKQIQQLQKRKEFVKPSVRKRQEILKAQYKNKFNLD